MSRKGGLPDGFRVRKNFNYVKELAQEKKDTPLVEIELDKIVFDPGQPRKIINEEGLRELAQSIKEKGVIEPVIVRPDGDKFILISGERRVRAAKIAGLKKVPVVVKKGLSIREIREIQLIENLQREDITPLERAEAIRDYLSPFIAEEELPRVLAQMEFSPDDVPKDVTDTVSVLLKNLGKSLKTLRRWVALLSLPDEIKERLRDPSSPITSRHIEELLKLKDINLMKEVMDFIEKEHLSSSQTKELVKEMKKGGTPRVGYKSFLNYLSKVDTYLTVLPNKKLRKPQKEKIKKDLVRLKEKIDKILVQL